MYILTHWYPRGYWYIYVALCFSYTIKKKKIYFLSHHYWSSALAEGSAVHKYHSFSTTIPVSITYNPFPFFGSGGDFLGPRPWHMEVPRLRTELELQLLACSTTATEMPDPSHVWDLHHSSRQHWILNPLSEARDWTCVLKDVSQIHFCWAMTGTPPLLFWSYFYFKNSISFLKFLLHLQV